MACIVSWADMKTFANSAFTTSLLGALAGAFAGATAAQRIAERSKYREELLHEIRNTNAAIALAYGICESFLALKKQHVKNLKEGYDTQKADALEFLQKCEKGENKDEVFRFQADMQTLQAQTLPMDSLRSVVFERLSIVGRPLNLVVTLSQTAQCLEDSIERRNALIEGYKAGGGKDSQRFVELYFGLPYGEGHINLDYPGTVDAIYSQTDDGIFFGKLLCDDLYEHGSKLCEAFKGKFKKPPPCVSKVDFSTVEASELIPDDEKYVKWVNAFVKKA
jgi:gas vesicle protein